LAGKQLDLAGEIVAVNMRTGERRAISANLFQPPECQAIGAFAFYSGIADHQLRIAEGTFQPFDCVRWCTVLKVKRKGGAQPFYCSIECFFDVG
jgi:hypothetical protein